MLTHVMVSLLAFIIPWQLCYSHTHMHTHTHTHTRTHAHTHTHAHTQVFVGSLLPKWLINRMEWQMMQNWKDRYLKKKAKKS